MLQRTQSVGMIYGRPDSIRRIAKAAISAGLLLSFAAGDNAEAAHAALAVAALPLGARNARASGDIGGASPGDERCLAMAVYYESGNEPRPGKEAVAQVVLNRLAHPTYPKSICDIVWQGARRRTGCQFTFTCDGSLARRPVGPAWEEAVTVARSAILASPRPDMMSALNYHADYVLPAWASRLRVVARVGRHIFYAEPAGGMPTGSATPVKMNTGVSIQNPRRESEPSVWGISLREATRR